MALQKTFEKLEVLEENKIQAIIKTTTIIKQKMTHEEITREQNPMFFKLWDIKSNKWFNHEIYATTTRDIEMSVWNQKHPVESNTATHTCKAGTRVRVWMVSRFGDVGVTDNLINPIGYDARGIDADKDLINYEFIDLTKPPQP